MNRYLKGDDMKRFAEIVRTKLSSGDSPVMVNLQPGDATTYDVVLFRHHGDYFLGHMSSDWSMLMNLSSKPGTLVPGYVMQKCHGANVHSMHVICQFCNEVFENTSIKLFCWETATVIDPYARPMEPVVTQHGGQSLAEYAAAGHTGPLPPVKHPDTGEKMYVFSQWASGVWLSRQPRETNINQEVFPVQVDLRSLEVFEPGE